MSDTTTGLTAERRAQRRAQLLDRIAQLERERDEARAEVESITSQWRATGRAEADAHRRAEKAEAALERVQSTFFNNGLYLRIVSIPDLNNEVGEVLYDRIQEQISKAIQGADDV